MVRLRGGVKDTRLEAKAKDTKKSEAKGEAPSRWAIFLRSPQKPLGDFWAIWQFLRFFAVGRLQESYFIAIGSHFASVQSHLKALNF